MTLRSSATGSTRPSVEGCQTGRGGGIAERRQPVVACIPFHQEDGRYPGVDERDDQVVDLGWPGRHDGQGRGRDDRQVARLEGVECRHPRLEDPHPADLALAPLGGQIVSRDRSCGREQRPMEIVERGHTLAGRRTLTRSSSSAPNSRSTST